MDSLSQVSLYFSLDRWVATTEDLTAAMKIIPHHVKWVEPPTARITHDFIFVFVFNNSRFSRSLFFHFEITGCCIKLWHDGCRQSAASARVALTGFVPRITQTGFTPIQNLLWLFFWRNLVRHCSADWSRDKLPTNIILWLCFPVVLPTLGLTSHEEFL